MVPPFLDRGLKTGHERTHGCHRMKIPDTLRICSKVIREMENTDIPVSTMVKKSALS
jgi:hypothetical protein